MSLQAISVPNNNILYISEVAGNTEFQNNVHVLGDLVVDGTISPGVTTNDVNFSVVDPTNSKLDITGLTDNTAASGQVFALDYNSQKLFYGRHDGTPFDNNIINFNGAGMEFKSIDGNVQAIIATQLDNANGSSILLETVNTNTDNDSAGVNIITDGSNIEVNITANGTPLNFNRFLKVTPNGVFANLTGGIQPNLVYYDSATKELTESIPSPTVQNINLVGNPVHQFVSGGTGILDFRGMISPLSTIDLAVNPTDIQMDVNMPNVVSALPVAQNDFLLEYDGASVVSVYSNPVLEGFSVYFSANFAPSAATITIPDIGVLTNTVSGQIIGYNSGLINLGTGLISIVNSGKYLVSGCISFSNAADTSIAPDNINLIFYDNTDAVILFQKQLNNIVDVGIHEVSIQSIPMLLSAGKDYKFEFVYSNVAAGAKLIYGSSLSNISLQRIY